MSQPQPLDSATPARPPKVPFFWQERDVFMFLGEKNCACGHYLKTSGLLAIYNSLTKIWFLPQSLILINESCFGNWIFGGAVLIST
jgi:hypothetical protein